MIIKCFDMVMVSGRFFRRVEIRIGRGFLTWMVLLVFGIIFKVTYE